VPLLGTGGEAVRRFLTKLWIVFTSRRGQSLVEYALILALVAIVVIVALTALGSNAESVLSNVSNTIGNVV
jgi:pilus assembly protein Flp/PilA